MEKVEGQPDSYGEKEKKEYNLKGEGQVGVGSLSEGSRQRDCSPTNVGDAARQWATAASSLALTENSDCLNHFVRLNGLSFLNHWLQEALKCSRDSIDCEELIKNLLGSLEKFSADQEKLSASGLLLTLENLISHENITVRERAQMLTEKWKSEKVNCGKCQAMETSNSCAIDNLTPPFATISVQVLDSSSRQTALEERNGGTENFPDRNADNLQSGVADGDAKDSTLQSLSVCSLNEDDKCTSITTAILEPKSSCQEKLSDQEESSNAPGGKAFGSTLTSPEVEVKDKDLCPASACDVKAEFKTGKAGLREHRNSFSILSSSVLSVSAPAENPTVARSASCSLESKEGKLIVSDTGTHHKYVCVEHRRPEYLKKLEPKSCEPDLKNFKDILLKGRPLGKEAAENSDEEKDPCNDLNSNTHKGMDTWARCDPSIISNVNVDGEMEKRSDSELESGEIDALEVARQVAIEVEREVVDYREELCSSPEVSSKEAANPGIAVERQDLSIMSEVNGNPVVAIKDDSEIASSLERDDHQFPEVVKEERGVLSPNATAVVQESTAKTEKAKCDFDLNEDACIEDLGYAVTSNYFNNVVNLSAPIAVSASKGSPGFAITPLHFEGELGWRGSAATSAFRPASPRRASDGEKSLSGSERKSNLGEIDLNVAQTESDLQEGPASVKELPFSSAITSRDSSAEVSSVRREKRVKLDLNCVGDEEPAFQSSLIRNRHQKGDQSLSTASSSYSRQPLPRNFDLNGNPCLFDAVSQKVNIPNAASIYGAEVNDPAFTIMRMESKIHTADRAQLSYMENMLPYAHQVPPPGYGYHGLIPFQSSHYVRGTNAVPQILGSAEVNGASLSTPPFLMSLTSATPNSSVTRPSFDLNFGMLPMEYRDSRESCSLKHSLAMEHDSLPEQMRTCSPPPPPPQVVSSGLSLVRKEPECSLDPYNCGYKQLASWH
ncbi:hypothetical protein AXF42_Ash007712 [Apostasia shenzhenica]|uniref:TFIIS N-terminal domain-containing protein n=1 Tax=Apostasia shenzhenica TaxID=1088818 RepID=A0A2I0A686_9ASPA|nr:hypothetical protein AXF42_Ash007712 [Apostasia shenzhenica]